MAKIQKQKATQYVFGKKLDPQKEADEAIKAATDRLSRDIRALGKPTVFKTPAPPLDPLVKKSPGKFAFNEPGDNGWGTHSKVRQNQYERLAKKDLHSFEIDEYERAFAAFYLLAEKAPTANWNFVVRRGKFTSDGVFWVTKNAQSDVDSFIFTSVAAVKGYEQFVRQIDTDADVWYVVDLTFSLFGKTGNSELLTLTASDGKANGNAASLGKPVKSKPAPEAGKRKIKLED